MSNNDHNQRGFADSLLAIIIALLGLLAVVPWGNSVVPKFEAEGKPTVIAGVKMAIVGEIVPHRNGGYVAARAVPANQRTKDDTLEVFVRRSMGGYQWGYVFFATAQEFESWQKVEARFKLVHAKHFMEIGYHKDFGAIRDPKRGPMTRTNGKDFYRGVGRDFVPQWVVFEMPNPEEG